MESSSKPDPIPPPPPLPPAANPGKDKVPSPGSTPIATSTQNPPLPPNQPLVSLPAPPKEPQPTEAAKPAPPKVPTSGSASNPNPQSKPPSQEQDVKVTTSAATTVPSSLPSAAQAVVKVSVSQNQPPTTQAPVSTSSSVAPTPLHTLSQPPTSLADQRTSSAQSTTSAVKRPQPEVDSVAATQQSTDSDNVPKRKKIRKEKEPVKTAQPIAEGKETGSSGTSGQEISEAKLDSSSSTSSNGGPKVPPIKIVLQSHGPTNGGAGNSGPGNESDSGNSSSHAHHHSANGSGFPYVVSSTTPDTNTTTTSSVPALSRTEVTTVLQDKKDSCVATAMATGEKIPEPPVLPVNSTAAPSKITTSVVPPPGATPTSSSGTVVVSTPSSQAPGEPVVHTESRKDPVVKLDIMSTLPTPTTASAAKEMTKEPTPVVTTASSIPTSGSSAVPVPVSGASSATSSGGSEETGTSTTTSVATTKETTTTTTTSKEKPQRVTRSSHRIATNTGGVTSHIFPLGTPHSPGGGSPKPSTSACPSPNHMEPMDVGACTNQKVDAVVGEAAVELGSKKRKIKAKDKEPSAPSSSSSSTSGEPSESAQAAVSTVNPNDPPLQNCVEMFLNIRKQIERRRRNLFPVQPKPPQGFKDYLMNRGTYVLASNSNAQLAVPTHTPPPSLPPQCKDMFIEQEKERHKLRIQQVVEKEKLVLSVEQEILRVHGRAARALSNQALPFSVCTILKDLEVYNLLTPEQEEKDRNARSRYNGRLFLSWLQDVDDKWDKIKEAMLLRHHNEAESLHAVQKMDWEWKLKEVGLCEPKANPPIDEIHVPMVNVSDDFDLLPA